MAKILNPGSPVLCSFAPVAAATAQTLILGSMPGGASLAAGRYYAHPQNQFWKIMGELVGAYPALPYEARLKALETGHIALWDVLETCTRPGSLDSAIRDETANNFRAFFKNHPQIRHVFFNGAKAEQSFQRYVLSKGPLPGISFHRLPSTSPAHAGMPFHQKLEKWRMVLSARADRTIRNPEMPLPSF